MKNREKETGNRVVEIILILLVICTMAVVLPTLYIEAGENARDRVTSLTTETVATEYSDTLYVTVKKLLDEGIGLCLDDFGSGYANLNTVLKLPFSAIKLDRSLLDGAVGDAQGTRFYQGVVSMFRELGYQIISEGTETKEEAELLKSWGVDLIQGFFYSRPLSENEIFSVIGETELLKMRS